jgi:hypothetical protein
MAAGCVSEGNSDLERIIDCEDCAVSQSRIDKRGIEAPTPRLRGDAGAVSPDRRGLR